jgi:hypothetical protein
MKIAYCGYDFFYACLNELLAGQHDVYRVFTFPLIAMRRIHGAVTLKPTGNDF